MWGGREGGGGRRRREREEAVLLLFGAQGAAGNLQGIFFLYFTAGVFSDFDQIDFILVAEFTRHRFIKEFICPISRQSGSERTQSCLEM